LAFKQTAGQMLSLLRVLPFFIHEKLNNIDADPHWLCITHLLRVVQLLFSLVIDMSWVTHATSVIPDHHLTFMALYPHAFIPKLHFLKHYPDQAINFGPLLNHMCFTFDAKHQTTKNVRWFIIYQSMQTLAADMHLPFQKASGTFTPW
jgi:hypothetical protein